MKKFIPKWDTTLTDYMPEKRALRIFIDKTGQRFHKLVALYPIKNGKWVCKCDCGNTTIVGTSKLIISSSNTTKPTKSCGCIRKGSHKKTTKENSKCIPKWDTSLTDFIPDNERLNKFIDRTGQRFHKLVVLYPIKDTGKYKGETVWVCKCDCGNIHNVRSGNLGRGDTKSCGCWRKEVAFKGYEGIGSTKWGSIKSCIIRKTRTLEFDITIEYAWDLYITQNKKCALSGLDIYFDVSKKKFGTASLDRIDSSKGYTMGNVQWVHKHVNTSKWDFDQDYFIDLCTKIANHRKYNEH